MTKAYPAKISHTGVGAIIGGYDSGAVVDAFSVYAEGGGLVSRDWTPVWLIFFLFIPIKST